MEEGATYRGRRYHKKRGVTLERAHKGGACMKNVSKGGARVENPHFSGALKWRAPLKVALSPKSSSKDGP